MSLGASEGHDDERDLEALEQHPLERDGERVPVHSRRRFASRGACLCALALECDTLVVERQVAARAQDRLAEPLQTERQQQRTDDEAERVDRNVGQRGPESRHDRSQHHGGGADTDQRRAPASNDADGEHDRQRLDRFDRACREDGQEEDDGGGHG